MRKACQGIAILRLTHYLLVEGSDNESFQTNLKLKKKYRVKNNAVYLRYYLFFVGSNWSAPHEL